MSEKEIRNCETRGRQEQPPTRQAWIDRDGKIISFHPIASSQLLEVIEPLFWENVIFLTNTGYRIQ